MADILADGEVQTLRNRFKRDAEFLLRGVTEDDSLEKSPEEKEAKPLPRINRHSIFWIVAAVGLTYYLDFFTVIMVDKDIKSWWFNVGLALLGISVALASFCIVYLDWFKGIQQYDQEYPALAPITTAVFIAASCSFNIALWPKPEIFFTHGKPWFGRLKMPLTHAVPDLDITDISAMVEHGGLDIMCLNKHRHSSSSSSTPGKGKKRFDRLRVSLREDYPKKNAEIISAQYGTNLFMFGAALMLAVSYHGQVVRDEHLLSFITTIMIMQLLWMLWYSARRDRLRTNLSEKDAHAATRWLRGGITVLALLSLIMDAFLIGQYVGYKACASAVLAVYPVVHTFHTISQVHFLWFHIKDVIKTFETVERFGVIHAVFTNLLLWGNGIRSESEHYMNRKRLSAADLKNHTEVENTSECNCSTSACSMFTNSLDYLHPFNIEYHIMVSAMLFVMWKNIGRTIEPHHNRKRQVTRNRGLVLGPILGLVALTGTITVLVVYTVKMKDSADSQGRSQSTMFYCHGIVMLACMCTAGALGLVLYRMDSRPLDASKNPARQLDTELLFGSSVGSWLMSWCSMVAVVATGAPGYSWTGFLYSLLLVLEKYVQNLFIIESLYRKQESDPHSSPEVYTVTTPTHDLPCNGIINRAYENQETARENGRVRGCPLGGLDFTISVPSTRVEKLSKKRQILKNIAVFLFLCNISLWLLSAFGCRPQYDSRLEQETFGFAVWTMVLNFAMPLNLFYRMHSVASLFEVFRKV
ncbi:hypothetical protein GJAV_G00167880 [Gymnothorax javanicus]|nr:hypothetical protein GJAV_G00167880 [Gymnothorax javanicus]